MKTTKILSALCGLALMLGGCANDDITNPAGSAKAPGVYVRLAGAAGKSNTRAGEEEVQTADEKKVNSVLAVLFDTHYKADASDSESRIGFYKTVDATLVDEATGEYSFIVEKDATYDIWLVANADNALTGLLKGTDGTDGALRPGATVEDFSSLIAAQAPDRQGEFLMVSTYSEKVTTEIDKTYSIGEVHMERLAARFDLVNKAEGVTVRKVTYGNRAVSSSLLTPNTMDPAIEYATWSTPDGFSLEGSKEPEATEIQLMYSYENVSKSGEGTLPVISIEYEQDGAVRTHEVQLIDPEAPAGTVLPIKRNHLYRLVLTKAGKLNFNLEVADWEEADAFGKSDLNEHLILPPDEQQKLNEQLLVYDLFTEYNVKSIDYGTKTVQFYDKHEFDLKELTKDRFFSFIDLNKQKLLTDQAILTDESENCYRIPTAGELQLLAPINVSTLPIPGFSGTEILYPHLTNATLYNGEFKEEVFLRDENNKQITNVDINNENEYGFVGYSQIQRGVKGTKITYKGTKYTEDPDSITTTFDIKPVYGIRFKGTNQYAAYRWEHTYVNNDRTNRVIAIRIKALPKDADIRVNDIVDNHSFWKDNYIELIFPLMGYFLQNAQTKEWNMMGYTEQSSYMSTTLTEASNSNFKRFIVGRIYTSISSGSTYTPNQIRLVKVKKSEAEDQK